MTSEECVIEQSGKFIKFKFMQHEEKRIITKLGNKFLRGAIRFFPP